MGADPHAVAERDRATHRGERVQRAVRPRRQLPGDIRLRRDVRVVAQPQQFREDRGGFGDVAPFADVAVPADRLLPLVLEAQLLLGRLLGEQPRTVFEMPYGRLLLVIHTRTLDSRDPARKATGALAHPRPALPSMTSTSRPSALSTHSRSSPRPANSSTSAASWRGNSSSTAWAPAGVMVTRAARRSAGLGVRAMKPRRSSLPSVLLTPA